MGMDGIHWIWGNIKYVKKIESDLKSKLAENWVENFLYKHVTHVSHTCIYRYTQIYKEYTRMHIGYTEYIQKIHAKTYLNGNSNDNSTHLKSPCHPEIEIQTL